MPRPSRQHPDAEVDFRGEKRTSTAHASTTDPDAQLCKKSLGTGAMLCFMGHALMENRSGLIVQGDLTQADGHAERAAMNMSHRHSPGSIRQLVRTRALTRPSSSPTCASLCHTTCRAENEIFSDRRPRHSARRLRPVDQEPQTHGGGLRLGQKPSGAWHRPSIAASSGCALASSSPWPLTILPDCPGCWHHDDEIWPQARRPSASLGPRPSAESKSFQPAGFLRNLFS